MRYLRARSTFGRHLGSRTSITKSPTRSQDRKAELAKLDKRAEFAALKPKERKEVPEYKTAADQIAAVAEKATSELRDKLDSEYKLAAAESFPDEDIFMAIAEDIGFDATGKPTKVNELDEIGAALAKFIKTAAEERT